MQFSEGREEIEGAEKEIERVANVELKLSCGLLSSVFVCSVTHQMLLSILHTLI